MSQNGGSHDHSNHRPMLGRDPVMSERAIDLGNTGAPASRLLRPRQAAQPIAAPDPLDSPVAAAPTERAPAASPPKTTPRTSSRPPTVPESKLPTERVGGYVPKDIRDRAVASHQATLYMEGETSWTDFVVKAIVAETHRREAEYNGGEPFELRSGGKLKTGRPLRS